MAFLESLLGKIATSLLAKPIVWLLQKFRLEKLWKSDTDIRLIRDGLEHFKQELAKAAQYGGTIFTTAIFEGYRDGDAILDYVRTLRTSPLSPIREVDFTRLVLLDDPSQEGEWIRNFLDLKREMTPRERGFLLLPCIYRIESKSRPLIRHFAKGIPRISITLFRLNEKHKESSTYQVYLGFLTGEQNTEFGLLISSRPLYDKTLNFLEPYKGRAIRYDDPDSFPDAKPARHQGHLRRIQDAILEYAEMHNSILHVGVFGSRGLIATGRLSIAEQVPLEADIDLLIVVQNQIVPVTPEFRRDIERIICAEGLGDDPVPQVEWSNLEGRYYEERSSVHVDIQIHGQGEDYYTTNARLLGYSIFDESYAVIYSASEDPVKSFLHIPEKILSIEGRINLVLESSEYGLRTAIERICNFPKFPATDPTRLAWIQTANIVWALTGRRPYTRMQGISFLEDCDAVKEFQSTLPDTLRDFLSRKRVGAAKDTELRQACKKLFQDFEAILLASL